MLYDKKSLGLKQNIDMLKKDKLLFNLSPIFENHHIFGKQNSSQTITLHKERHDFITNRTNALGKYNKDPYIQLLTSLIGAFELRAFELRHVIHLYLNCPEKQKQFIKGIDLSIEKTKEAVELIFENGNNNG